MGEPGAPVPAGGPDDRSRAELPGALAAAQSALLAYQADPGGQALDELIRVLEAVLRPPMRALLSDERHSAVAGNLGMAWWWSYTSRGRTEDLDQAIRRYEEALAHPATTAVGTPRAAGQQRIRLGLVGGLARCLREKAGVSGERDHLDRAVGVLGAALRPLTGRDDDWTDLAVQLALALQERYDIARDFDDLQRAASLRREVVVNAVVGDVGTARGELAACLLELDAAGGDGCLDEAISVLRPVAAGRTVEADTPVEVVFTLGVALARRFERAGSQTDARDAVVAFETAVALGGDGPGAKFRDGLGSALHDLWRVTGDGPTLDRAVEELERALPRCSDAAARLRVHLNLGLALRSRFEHAGAAADLRGALDLLAAAVAVAPDDPRLLTDLAGAHLDAYGSWGAADDLAEALRLLDLADERCPAGAPDHRAVQTTRGNALRHRFDRSGDIADLDEAIRCHRGAVSELEPAMPDAPVHFTMYGHALRARYALSGDRHDLDEAAWAYGRAGAYGARDGVIAAKGTLALDTYQRTGRLEDVDAAIDALTRATSLCAPGSPALPSHLSGLAMAHRLRYLHTGQLRDLEQAIELIADAVGWIDPGNPARAVYLANSGTVWLDRFDCTGDLDSLDRGVADLAAAAEATPEQAPQRPAYLANLGNALLGRHELATAISEAQAAGRPRVVGAMKAIGGIDADPHDLDNAVALLRTAASLAPDEAPSRPRQVSMLGQALLARYQRDGEESDLDEAVALLDWALDHADQRDGDGHPYRPRLGASLAYALRYRWQHRHTPDDLHRAVQCYETACREGITARASTVVATAYSWAVWALERRSWDEARRAYQWCLEGVGQLIAGHQARHHKEVWLFKMGDLASRAAYAFARAGDPLAAAGMFEQGRALLLQEATGQRGGPSSRHPDLDARLGHALAGVDAAAAAALRAVDTREVPADLVTRLEQTSRDLDQAFVKIAEDSDGSAGRVDLDARRPDHSGGPQPQDPAG